LGAAVEPSVSVPCRVPPNSPKPLEQSRGPPGAIQGTGEISGRVLPPGGNAWDLGRSIGIKHTRPAFGRHHTMRHGPASAGWAAWVCTAEDGARPKHARDRASKAHSKAPTRARKGMLARKAEHEACFSTRKALHELDPQVKSGLRAWTAGLRPPTVPKASFCSRAARGPVSPPARPIPIESDPLSSVL